MEALNHFARIFGLDRQKSAHIFVIDFSGSMLWPPVKGAKGPAPKPPKGKPPAPTRWDVLLEALPTLLDAIPAGDMVWVFGFHETIVEDPAWVFAQWKGVSSRDFLIQSLRKQNSFGNWTNVGLALRRAMEILRNAEPRIQNVYLLTDGMHDVPENNDFFSRDARAWKDLGENWAGLFRDASRILLFSMYGLFDVADFSDVKAVVPKVKFLAFSGTGDLNLVFREQVNTALFNLVETQLERERTTGGVNIVTTPLHLDYTNGERRFSFQLESTFSRLPVSGKIHLEVVQKPQNSGFSVQLDTDSFQLEPGKKLTIGGTLTATVPQARFYAQRQENAVLRIALSQLEFEPREVFDAAGLASLRAIPRVPAPAELPLQFSMRYGRWPHYYKTIAVSALAALILLLLYFIWRTRPRWISGEIEWEKTPPNWEYGTVTAIEGKKSVRIGSGKMCSVKIESLPSLFLEIHNRPKGLFGRHVVVMAGCKGITQNDRPVESGKAYPVVSSRVYTYVNIEGQRFEFRLRIKK